MLAEAEPLLRHGTQGNIWELNTVRIFRMFGLRYLGRWREMRTLLADFLLDAIRRGDRYAETTLSRGANLAWLVADDPARAHREIATRGWTPPEGGYHMQHWYELRARIDLALYEGDLATARQRLADATGPLERSLLLRAQTIRSEMLWLRGKVALLDGRPDEAAAMARKLVGEKVAYARVWARMLDAGLAARRGGSDAARPLLADVVRLADEVDLSMCAAAARILLDDARGEDAMLVEGIKQPARMIRVLLPGFQP